MDNPAGSEKLRRPIVALVLSILTIGLGQLYSTRHRRALFFYGTFLAIWSLYVFTPVTYSPTGMVLSIAVAGCFAIVQVSDAWRTAKKVRAVPLRRYNRWFVYLLIVAINHMVVLPFLPKILPPPVKGYRIPSSGMEPALEVGDYIVADRRGFDRTALERGDIVVFYHPTERKEFVKRVIGLPGETIETRGQQVLVNHRVLYDPWGIYRGSRPSPDVGPIHVPPRGYFLIGDNRNNSWDSRAWGCPGADLIRAKVLYIYWSRDKSRIGKPVK